MNKLKPILTLVLLTPVLVELISESSPLPVFFNPPMLVLFLVAYGVAVLLIREIAVRYRLGPGDIFILGIAYGVFNEGLFAKTLIHQEHLPVAAFDHYGYLLGVNFPWTAFITLWHGIASVLFPILFTHLLFPAQSQTPWMRPWLTNVLAIILLVISSLGFSGKSNGAGTHTQLAVLWGIMLICVLIVALRKRSIQPAGSPAPLTLKPIILGLSIFLFLVVAWVIAGRKLPVPLFFAALGLYVWIYLRILKSQQWVTPPHLALFGVGCYLESVILGTLLSFAMGRAPLAGLITGIVAVIVLIWFARGIIRGAIPPSEHRRGEKG